MVPANKCLTLENFKENKHSFELKLTWDWKGSNICDGEGLGHPSSLNTLDQVNYM